MERYGFGSRILAALLVLTMLVSCMPGTVWAADIGDILSDDPGIVGELDTQDTISWPVRIYDYLTDGMLFGASQSKETEIYAHNGGSYGGGQPMPMIGGIRGIDYTSVAGYYNYSNDTYAYTEKHAFTDWGSKSAYSVCYDSDATEVERSIVQPVKDQSPMYLHLEHTGTGETRSYGWISDFARDEGAYLSKEDIRYAVIVYRTNESYPADGHGVRLYWSVSDADYDTDYSTYGGQIDISDVTDQWGWQSGGNYTGLLTSQMVSVPNSADWSYVVVDMKSDLSGSDYGIASNWDRIEDERIAGVGLGLPLLVNGETMDISHIAYFGTSGEAERFGQKCVAFDNDPGEYLGYTIDMTHSVSGGTGSSTAAAPTVSARGWDFTTANAGAWNDSVFATWADTFGLTTTQGNAGYHYVNVSNADSVMDQANIWDSASLSSIDDMRYVTVVYRTHGITAPAIGMWLADDIYGFEAGREDQYRVEAAASENSWVAFTYDLYWLESRFGLTVSGLVDTFTQIGILFPGFTSSSQSMDIAYIDYDTSSDEAQYFAATATEYLNGYTVTGDSVVTTLTRSASPVGNEMWNMGNNQAFSMLYASSGGGWFDGDHVNGGENLWTNGYYSYQIGYNYMYQNSSNTTNDIRQTAQTMGYPVSDSIFMLNTYGSSPSYLYGVSYEEDDSGYAIASSKYFDMSQLDLGYTLYSAMTGSGVMTAGLLESGLTAYQGMDGQSHTVLQYKDDTVSYIAALLRDSLTIPERDYWGYNYNFVKGTPNAQFCEDVDGDGKLDVAEDLDGDGHLDVDEDVNGNGILDPDEDVDADGILDVAEDQDEDVNGNGILDAQDLASALRQVLQITFPEDVETIQDQTSHGTVGVDFGSYAETAEKFAAGPNGENLLIGPFLKCAPYIETVYDAAWYLLHNLFVPGSYNQVRDEYDTLVLSKATLSDGQEAYVFDSAFTTADAVSATVYDKENKTIYQADVADKHQVYYTSIYSTVLCPFLPIDVDDCTGPYAVTGTPYVRDDAAENVSDTGATWADRNYSYVMVANGQFTYNSEIDQRLEVSGDDDMYLFVNGELVMDVGACHSITSAQVVIGDAVNAAYHVMAELAGYEAGMSDEALEELLASQGIVGDQAQTYRRNHRLCLIDGQSYPIDLYFMERMGWGSNLRVAATFQIQPMEEEGTDIVATGTCGQGLSWALYPDGVLEIWGEGDMDMFTDADAQPWAAYRDQIAAVVISEGVTSIGSYAFSGCMQVEDVIIPETVSAVGNKAFEMCMALPQIHLPEGLTSLEASTFLGCSSLVEVYIPSTVRSIGEAAFGACSSLVQVDLPEGLTSLGSGAFSSCSALYTVRIPGGVNEIGAGAFAGCTGLTSVEVSEGVSVIGGVAFSECSALTWISLPETLSMVMESAFCSAGLQTVEYAGSLDQWVQILIEADNDPLTQAQINYGKEHSHSYDAVVEEATCTQAGVTTYTCAVCGDSYTQTIPALGHDPDAMGCQFCGPLNYRLYYDDALTGWGTVYVYYWSEEDTMMTTWPGVLMTDEGNGVFSCVIPSDADYVIFNKEASGQTAELQVPGGGYMYSNETWVSCCSHTYENDICTDCGHVYQPSYQLYYDDAATGWGEVYVYYWVDAEQTSMIAWPGERMTYEENGLFSCVIPGEADRVIFNTGNGEGQTADLTIPGDKYVYSDGAWVPYCDHSYGQGETTVEPGCATEGQRTFTCTICGDTYEETIPATGHDYESVVTDATCTDAGYTTHTCSVCGDSYMDSDVAALGHDYTSTVTDATCTEDGTTVYTCGNCGDSYSETIPATGHSYENGSCTVCGEADPDWVRDPGLTLSYPTLSFEDEIIYNVYYTVSDMTSVVEMGLMILSSRDDAATIDDAVSIVPGYVTNGTVYLAKSEGVPAANMGDALYFKVYAKLTDGSYAYSTAGGYSAKAYANTVLNGDYSAAMKSLVVAMVNYGAEAQLFFGHNTDKLVNAALTDEQKALVGAYDETMMDDVVPADSSKTANFVRVNSNFQELYPSVSFDGAFSINFYCTPAIGVDDGMTLYYWDTDTYDSITEFSVDNATGSMEMTVTNGQYWGKVPGIAAKDMDKTYYVSCVFESEGETITTGIISYSLGKYCEGKAATDGDAQQAFAQATAVYGYYAKQYFGSIA